MENRGKLIGKTVKTGTFLKEAKGLTIVEYVICSVLIVVVVIAVFFPLGVAVATKINDLAAQLEAFRSGPPASGGRPGGGKSV